MDPISLLFSAYIDTVSNDIHQRFTETMGTELQAVVIQYEGVDIPYQYQMWKVRDKTVCASYAHETIRYSECTVKAHSLFTGLCQELSAKPKQHWKYVKTKNMYCNAAVTFKPTIASISKPKEADAAQLAKQACNAAIVTALGSSDPRLIADRRAKCEHYESLKQ